MTEPAGRKQGEFGPVDRCRQPGGVSRRDCLFVLIRLNGKVDRLVEAIRSLEKTLNNHLSRDDVKAIIRSYLNLDVPRDPDDKGC